MSRSVVRIVAVGDQIEEDSRIRADELQPSRPLFGGLDQVSAAAGRRRRRAAASVDPCKYETYLGGQAKLCGAPTANMQ